MVAAPCRALLTRSLRKLSKLCVWRVPFRRDLKRRSSSQLVWLHPPVNSPAGCDLNAGFDLSPSQTGCQHFSQPQTHTNPPHSRQTRSQCTLLSRITRDTHHREPCQMQIAASQQASCAKSRPVAHALINPTYLPVPL